MGSNKQKRYDEEFKASSVKMIIEKGISVMEVSKSLDVSEPALRRWIAASTDPEGSENSRIKELEAELKKLKKENGIKSTRKPKWKQTTNSKHDLPIAPNLLNQDFNVCIPNSVYVGDITYNLNQ